jgi:hypothetical protein
LTSHLQKDLKTEMKIDLTDFGITLEFVKKAQYGNVEVTEISDTHLQNARIRALRKLKEVHERALTLKSLGYPVPSQTKRKLGFYDHMLKTCQEEINRRFMKHDLVSIPYSNTNVFINEASEAALDAAF